MRVVWGQVVFVGSERGRTIFIRIKLHCSKSCCELSLWEPVPTCTPGLVADNHWNGNGIIWLNVHHCLHQKLSKWSCAASDENFLKITFHFSDVVMFPIWTRFACALFCWGFLSFRVGSLPLGHTTVPVPVKQPWRIGVNSTIAQQNTTKREGPVCFFGMCSSLGYIIEVETKWPPFSRRHFQIIVI